ARVSELFRDISLVVAQELARPGVTLGASSRPTAGRRVAFHSPCTLQHGLKVRDVIEPLLQGAGCTLTSVADGHLCCGSAGTYSILQPAISRQLGANKLAALQAGAPDVIATANIGCLLHLASGADRPVRHWIELLAEGI
ncbi:MAG TPA: heterodisulfide reductase-related iron-sulfur binding cluster, partial [Steroidobacteraceae bacterium]|nr:heterodisulfide reductase-related iron-sulfur binding cluster [Steroidobacteraceae bacterium]